MVELRFRGEEVWRDCCDLARMRSRWGESVARRVSRRLQQLEAMTSPDDLGFLPLDSFEHDGGVLEIAVTDRLSLFAVRGPHNLEVEHVHTLTITALRDSARTDGP